MLPYQQANTQACCKYFALVVRRIQLNALVVADVSFDVLNVYKDPLETYNNRVVTFLPFVFIIFVVVLVKKFKKRKSVRYNHHQSQVQIRPPSSQNVSYLSRSSCFNSNLLTNVEMYDTYNLPYYLNLASLYTLRIWLPKQIKHKDQRNRLICPF